MEIIRTLDHEIIARLNKDVQDVHVLLYPEYFKAYDFESVNGFYKQIMNNPDFYFLVIKEGEQCFGYAWMEIRDFPGNVFKKANKSIVVHQLGICNEYRNQGLGQKLMNRIEEIAREKGIQQIHLDYWDRNEMAKNFYKKNGYTVYREFIYKNLE